MIGLKSNSGQQRSGSRLNALSLPSLEAWNYPNIFFDAQLGKHTDFLDNVPDTAPELNRIPFRSRFAIHFRLPFCGIDQTVDQFHCRGFAGTASTEQHQCLPTMDFQAEI